MVGQFSEERLVIWITPTQSVKADVLMGKVDFAAHRSMQPVLVHEIGFSEQMDGAVLMASADEDHGALDRGVEVELEPFGNNDTIFQGAHQFASCDIVENPMHSAKQYSRSDPTGPR